MNDLKLKEKTLCVLIFLLLPFIVFVSCDKNEPANEQLPTKDQIVGVYKSSDGSPIADVEVLCFTGSSDVSWTKTTDKSGRFGLNNILSGDNSTYIKFANSGSDVNCSSEYSGGYEGNEDLLNY